jgi:hypothetical protein
VLHCCSIFCEVVEGRNCVCVLWCVYVCVRLCVSRCCFCCKVELELLQMGLSTGNERVGVREEEEEEEQNEENEEEKRRRRMHSLLTEHN